MTLAEMHLHHLRVAQMKGDFIAPWRIDDARVAVYRERFARGEDTLAQFERHVDIIFRAAAART